MLPYLTGGMIAGILIVEGHKETLTGYRSRPIFEKCMYSSMTSMRAVIV